MEVRQTRHQSMFFDDSSIRLALGPWRQVQSAVRKIHELHQTLNRDAETEPVIIAYNETVSLTNLASVAQMTASGSTNFVRGKFRPGL